MLLSFSVADFKSTGRGLSVNMLPYKSENKRNLASVLLDFGKADLLRRACVAGGNASGKSTLLQAFAALRECALYEGVLSHLQSADFDVNFTVKSSIYRYVLTVADGECVRERLLVFRDGGMRPVFLREGRSAEQVSFGSVCNSGSDFSVAEAGVLTRSLTSGTSFFSLLLRHGMPLVEDASRFFARQRLLLDQDDFLSLPEGSLRGSAFLDGLSRFLASMDLGVSSVSLGESLRIDDFDMTYEQLVRLRESGSGLFMSDRRGFVLCDGLVRELYVTHRPTQGGAFSLPLSRESAGTARLVQLYAAMFAGRAEDALVLVDDLDERLHPLITLRLVDAFLSAGSKTLYPPQMVFTVRGADCFSLKHLREEELWIMQKDAAGLSSLRPLTDFTLESDVSLRGQYLSGLFGGVPALR